MLEFILPGLASISIILLAVKELYDPRDNAPLSRRLILIVLLFLGLGSVWFENQQNRVRRLEANAETENLTDQLKKTRAQLTTLQLSSDSSRSALDSLIKLYAPVVNKARQRFPELKDADAIKSLLSKIDESITSIIPKLVYKKGKDRSGTVVASGLSFHRFVFESQPPGNLRNQHLLLDFDNTINSAEIKVFGAIVVEQGKRISIGSDSMSVSCFVDLLRADNSLYVEVTSTSEIILGNVKINE